jgi:hypothetical protein
VALNHNIGESGADRGVKQVLGSCDVDEHVGRYADAGLISALLIPRLTQPIGKAWPRTCWTTPRFPNG